MHGVLLLRRRCRRRGLRECCRPLAAHRAGARAGRAAARAGRVRVGQGASGGVERARARAVVVAVGERAEDRGPAVPERGVGRQPRPRRACRRARPAAVAEGVGHGGLDQGRAVDVLASAGQSSADAPDRPEARRRADRRPLVFFVVHHCNSKRWTRGRLCSHNAGGVREGTHGRHLITVFILGDGSAVLRVFSLVKTDIGPPYSWHGAYHGHDPYLAEQNQVKVHSGQRPWQGNMAPDERGYYDRACSEHANGVEIAYILFSNTRRG
jgi:hypothetical protein